MCATSSNNDHITVRSLASLPGIELVEARFRHHVFTPHRHDDYVIGITLNGAQQFCYRGQQHCATAGQAFILHPDERHDGRAGTENGYGYRAAYIAPSLITEALDHKALPFISEGVSTNRELIGFLKVFLSMSSGEDDPLRSIGLLTNLADKLADLAGYPHVPKQSIDPTMVYRIKDQLHADPTVKIRLADLESEHGVDRFSITRQFRRYFGVSPHRYLVMRRLELVRQHLLKGASLVDAAITAGFADQSHMNRHFRRAFGLTPGQWLDLVNRSD